MLKGKREQSALVSALAAVLICLASTACTLSPRSAHPLSPALAPQPVPAPVCFSNQSPSLVCNIVGVPMQLRQWRDARVLPIVANMRSERRLAFVGFRTERLAAQASPFLRGQARSEHQPARTVSCATINPELGSHTVHSPCPLTPTSLTRTHTHLTPHTHSASDGLLRDGL